MKKIIYLILSFFIIGCAVQGPIPGGEIDKQGPILIDVIPPNFTEGIKLDEKITLFFNEPVENNSAYKFHNISDPNYKLIVRGKKIIISPKVKWDNKLILNININRGLKDFS